MSTRPGPLARYGPLGLVLAALVALVAVSATAPDPGADTQASPVTTAAGPRGIVPRELPEGVMPFSVARERGRLDEFDWGERCDRSTGRLKLPLVPAPECFARFTGDNGGETGAPGITGDRVKVVVYSTSGDDPILKLVYAQIGAQDAPDAAWDTYNAYNTIFQTYYETYGRRVELVRFTASGNILDPVAAAADAERIARDIRPFLVIGGPQQTSAFAEKLAQLGIMCLACAPAQPAEFYQRHDPFIWDVFTQVDQALELNAEFLGKRVFGYPAVHAGDESMHQTTRKVGLVRVRGSSGSGDELLKRFTSVLADRYDARFTEVVTYENAVALNSTARDLIARLKASGVTTVVLATDPVAPRILTTTATEQGWFPEWVVTGSVLTDTSVFGRSYDQRQWAHAFGTSNLLARIDPEVAGAGYLHRWFFGRPPAATSSPLIVPGLQVLFGVLQGMGPRPTYELWKAALYSTRIPGTLTSAQLSWGRQGVWPEELGEDHAGIDDQVEIWWDANAEGRDEIGKPGRGMWRYVDGGRRYLPGTWPRQATRAFDPEGAVAVYSQDPAGVPPAYTPLPPPAGG